MMTTLDHNGQSINFNLLKYLCLKAFQAPSLHLLPKCEPQESLYCSWKIQPQWFVRLKTETCKNHLCMNLQHSIYCFDEICKTAFISSPCSRASVGALSSLEIINAIYGWITLNKSAQELPDGIMHIFYIFVFVYLIFFY